MASSCSLNVSLPILWWTAITAAIGREPGGGCDISSNGEHDKSTVNYRQLALLLSLTLAFEVLVILNIIFPLFILYILHLPFYKLSFVAVEQNSQRRVICFLSINAWHY
jgi:hypothetical protein